MSIYVTSGVISTGVLVENTDMTVYVGGTASHTSVTTSGYLFDIGRAVSTTVNSGGRMYNYGGISSATTLLGAGSFQQVQSGASAVGTTVNSGAALYESGVDKGTKVNSGGVEFVFSGGVSTKAVITGQGSESIYSYGQQLAGGTAKKAIVKSGGIQNVNSNGTAIGTKISASGFQYVEGTGIAKNTLVYKGGTEELIGGTSIGSKISHGAKELVSSGVASNTKIAGGTLELGVPGGASGAISFSGSGGQLILDTTTMPSAVISGFAPGDEIKLAGVTYNKHDTVAVTSAGLVTITAGGQDYTLNIAGAAVGSTAFVFGKGSILTTTAAPAMAFLHPQPQPAAASPWLATATAVPPPPAVAPAPVSAHQPGAISHDHRTDIRQKSFTVISAHGHAF